MAYRITYTPDAELDLRALRRFDQARIRTAIPQLLANEPSRPSLKRQPLAPNPLGAPWELRLGTLRVFYAIDETAQVVRILRAGRQAGNRLSLRGVPVELR